MHVARELKMTLVELNERMTPEELELWLAFFQIEQDELKKQSRMR
jgi:hypothetical protein